MGNENTDLNTPVHDSVKFVQMLPGRIGLRIRSLKDSLDFAKRIKASLEELACVREVDINVSTGNVLISLSNEYLNHSQIEALIQRLEQHFPPFAKDKLIQKLSSTH